MKNSDVKNSGKVSAGHPIDVATGKLFNDFDDYSLNGRIPLIFARRYSTGIANKSEGMFGDSWSSPFEMKIFRDIEGYRIIAEDGETEIEFDDPDDLIESGGVVRNFGAFHEICQQGNNFIVTRWDSEEKDVVRYIFPKGKEGNWWYLARRENLESHGIDIYRDAMGRIIGLKQNPEGRGYRLTYNIDGRVTNVSVTTNVNNSDNSIKLKDKDYPILQYKYDNNGRLCEVISPRGHSSRYEYNEAGRMSREITASGMVFTFTYNSDWQCIESAGSDNYWSTTLNINKAARLTEVTNSLGHTKIYEWNDNGQVEREISPLGNVSTKTYDDYGRIIAEINPNQAATKYEFDEYGNRCKITDPLGNATSFTFNDAHLPITMTDPNGGVWKREYDSDNRLITTADPLGNQWTFNYDSNGNLIRVTDPKGSYLSQSFSSNGILQASTDWEGHATRYRYDLFGNLIEKIGPTGDVTGFRYDNIGNLIEICFPDQTVVKAAYDSGSNLSSFTDANGHTTRYSYGKCERLIERIDPLKNIVRYHWGSEPDYLDNVINEKGELYI